jgi:HK97 family phage portal protein
MGLMKSLKTFLVKQSLSWRVIIMRGDDPRWTKKDYKKLSQAGYQNCMTVFACVNLIAKAIGGLPWALYQVKKGKGGKVEREELEDHPLLNLIKRPNPIEGKAKFFEKVISFFLLAGNSFIEAAGPKGKPPKELYTLRPDRMTVLKGDRLQLVRGYEYKIGNNKETFDTKQVLHVKTFHPTDDYYGLSFLEVAAKGIDIQAMASEWNARLLQNDCRPPGAIVTEGNLEEEQHERLEKQLEEKMQGYKNAGRPPVFEAGVKWQPFAITPRDMDWLNSDKLNSRKIASVFGVAPELIGDAENKTYSNYKEARKSLYEETALPLAGCLCDEFNYWLVPKFEKNPDHPELVLEIARERIDAIQEDRQQVFDRMDKAWWFSVNERRQACGKDDVRGGNVIMVPANLIPLLTIGDNILEE